MPNAGKSTLLSRVTAARPKIADYPFTTLTPNLGIVNFRDNRFVVADIPGLIEGAHEGRGLGIQFLRHIERTRILLFLIDCSENTIEETYETLREELRSYKVNLLDKPHCVALTKVDIALEQKRKKIVFQDGIPIFRISAVTGEGIETLLQALCDLLNEEKNRS